MDVYPLNKCSLGLRMAIGGYETPTVVDVRQPHSFTGPSRRLTPIQIHATRFGGLACIKCRQCRAGLCVSMASRSSFQSDKF